MPEGGTAPKQTGTASAERPATPQVRVFVGLKIVPALALELARLAVPLEGPSVRPVAPDDVHLTLVPPWREASIPEAIEKLGLVAGRFATFRLTFEHVDYGPQPRRPRLLWVRCTAGEELASLRAALLAAYGQKDERLFRPHITLARIRDHGLAIARRHPIDCELSLGQPVETVELFQSPPPGERGYRVLASLRLGAAHADAGNQAKPSAGRNTQLISLKQEDCGPDNA